MTKNEKYGIGVVFFAIAAFLISIKFISICSDVVDARVIDEKIQLYEEANTEISNYVSEVVSSYKEYESETFEKIDNPNIILSTYPELKTNELLMSQIEIYNRNKSNILDLKMKKLNYSNSKWLMYFGK